MGLSKDDALHSSLLIFNELLRIANVEAEKTLINVIHRASSDDSQGKRVEEGKTNPLKELLQPVYPTAVESRTARALVCEHYFSEVSSFKS